MLGVTSTSIRVTGVDFAFVPVTDFVVVKRFYGKVLGLEQPKQYLAQRQVRLGDRAGPCPEGREAEDPWKSRGFAVTLTHRLHIPAPLRKSANSRARSARVARPFWMAEAAVQRDFARLVLEFARALQRRRA